MNERYGHDPYGQQPPQQPEVLGYDEYGQPIYRQEPQHGYPGYQPGPEPGGYDPYGSDPYGADPYRADPYGAGQQGQFTGHPVNSPGPYGAYPTAAAPHDPGTDGSGAPDHSAWGQQRTYQEQRPHQRQEWIPHQQQAEPAPQSAVDTGQLPPQQGAGEPVDSQLPRQRQGEAEYEPEQFSFVEERAEESEDVIDWLKFTESRTERREEAKRRGRHRITALVVVLALVAVGGAGYLWYAGKIPGLGAPVGRASAPQGQQRDVIAVHLRAPGGKQSSSALLVDNAGSKRGSTLLLPNTLALGKAGGGSTTLARSVVTDGAAPTREALGTQLGADIKGTWRLDTPFLENLVDLLGGITMDTDTTVPGGKKGQAKVPGGKAQDLDGRAAVDYATYQAAGEPQTRQLNRFGQVLQATLRKMSSDPKSATRTVQQLGQIPDPSLSESELGASLAKLAGRAKGGDYGTELLPVRANGTLIRGAGDGLVKRLLGGTVKAPQSGGAPRVKVTDASGHRTAGNAASAALTNGGYTAVDGGKRNAAARHSLVTYGSAKQRTKAVQVAKTLGLPGSAVRAGQPGGNAEVSVVLGRDYRG